MSREALLQEAAAAIVERDPDRALAVARKALELGVDPLVVIEQGFTRGLIQVGDLFERGELFLPELIQCAEIMKSVSGMLNEAISVERREAAGRGGHRHRGRRHPRYRQGHRGLFNARLRPGSS